MAIKIWPNVKKKVCEEVYAKEGLVDDEYHLLFCENYDDIVRGTVGD